MKRLLLFEVRRGPWGVDGGFEKSAPVVAGEVAVLLALLEEEPAVARVEAQSREELHQLYREMFSDNSLIADSLEPDDLPLQISVWAHPYADSGLSFRSLMWALDARPDVFAVVQRVGLCLKDFMSDTINCELPAAGPVDIVLFVGRDGSLANVVEIVGQVGSASIEVADSEATLFEVAEMLDIDLFEGRLSSGDVLPSVRLSNVDDPDALIEELTQRFDAETYPPTIMRPGQGCS